MQILLHNYRITQINFIGITAHCCNLINIFNLTIDKPGQLHTPWIRFLRGVDVASGEEKVKIQVGATEEQHQMTLHGMKWLSNGSGFGRAGHFRLSYCVTADTIEQPAGRHEFRIVVDPLMGGARPVLAIALHRRGDGGEHDLVASLAAIPQVQEIHYVAGKDGYLLKVRESDTRSLGDLVRNRIAPIEGVRAIDTTIVMNTFKETARIPIDNDST